MPELQVTPRDWQKDLQAFSQSAQKPIYMWMYPALNEAQDQKILRNQLAAKIPPLQSRIPEAKIFKVTDHADWNISYYRDGIHPNGQGNAVLANIIRQDFCLSPIRKMQCQ